AYSQLIAHARCHNMKPVACGNGAAGPTPTATGELTSGKSYTTVIPGQPTSALSAQLTADGVTSVTAEAPRSGLGSVLLYFLFLLLPIILVFWLIRRMSRAGGGAAGPQGVFGGGRGPGKGFDGQRAPAQFSDVGGHEGGESEIGEGDRLLRQPPAPPPGRRDGSARTADDRPAGHRQDAPGQGRGRRGHGAVLLGHRLELRGDVRRGRRGAGA